MSVSRVAVIGGGISGLLAAWELTGGDGARAPGRPDHPGRKASADWGGPLRSETFGRRGRSRPRWISRSPTPKRSISAHAVDRRIARAPSAGRGGGVWARGRGSPAPEGWRWPVPSRFLASARSGILGVRGVAGWPGTPSCPGPTCVGPSAPVVGPLVAQQAGGGGGRPLVDPLIGGIHAGSSRDMSTTAIFPPLLAAAQRRGSLMRALRAEVPARVPMHHRCSGAGRWHVSRW